MPGKASSRGRDAVLAAATAARAAAAAIAAENIARPPAQEIDTAVDEETVMLIQDNTPVLDLKGICAIGTGPDEPIRSYKLLLLPSGQTVRVPYCPGHYVVSTDSWTDITFPCWVMFEDSLKRKDELAVAVLDYSRVNPDLELMSIESLQQPIRVRNQVYRSHKECRITSMDRIKRFRAINAAAIEEGGVAGPWAEQFGPYKELNIKGRAGVWDFCNKPVRSRLPQLVELARAEAARVHAEDEVQDKRMADITYNLKLGHVNKLAERLAAMNLSSYDQKLEERIRIFDAESTEQLKTPERGEMTAGTARIVTTRFADVMVSLDEVAEQPAAPAAANNDEFRNIEEVDAEVEEDAASEPAVAPAPAAATAAAPVNNSQPPTAKSMRRRQQPKKAQRYQLEPLEKPDGKRKKASGAQQEAPGNNSSAAEVLLNRDGVPYKRGGPYRPRATKASSSAAGASGAAPQPRRSAGKQIDITAADTDSTALRDRIASLESALDKIRAENHELERQKLSLEMQLKSQAENIELRIDAVKAKVGAEYQNMLHQQFMSGLATGSAMASQGAMHVPGVQPFSFGGGVACPARSASMGSSMPGSAMGT